MNNIPTRTFLDFVQNPNAIFYSLQASKTEDC
eukprot:UN22022